MNNANTTSNTPLEDLKNEWKGKSPEELTKGLTDYLNVGRMDAVAVLADLLREKNNPSTGEERKDIKSLIGKWKQWNTTHFDQDGKFQHKETNDAKKEQEYKDAVDELIKDFLGDIKGLDTNYGKVEGGYQHINNANQNIINALTNALNDKNTEIAGKDKEIADITKERDEALNSLPSVKEVVRGTGKRMMKLSNTIEEWKDKNEDKNYPDNALRLLMLQPETLGIRLKKNLSTLKMGGSGKKFNRLQKIIFSMHKNDIFDHLEAIQHKVKHEIESSDPKYKWTRSQAKRLSAQIEMVKHDYEESEKQKTHNRIYGPRN